MAERNLKVVKDVEEAVSSSISVDEIQTLANRISLAAKYEDANMLRALSKELSAAANTFASELENHQDRDL